MKEYIDLLNNLGIISIIIMVITFILDTVKSKMNLKFEKIYLEKEKKYQSILVYMLVMLDVAYLQHLDNQESVVSFLREEEIKKYYMEKVEVHLKYVYLFASMEVIHTISQFLKEPSEYNYSRVALAMRKDLWNKKLK